MKKQQEFNQIEINGISIRREKTTTDQILSLRNEDLQQLKDAIVQLHVSALPYLPDNKRDIYINDYFTPGGGRFYRQAFLFTNQEGRLIGANICNCGVIEYEGKTMNGVYLISSAILPEYQSYGLGKLIGIALLNELAPDILFTTSTHSAALHSRVGLIQKGLVSGYDVYPRLERMDGQDVLISAPFKDMDFILSAFRQLYLALVDGQKEVDIAVRDLTVFMVRKNNQTEAEGYSPWELKGRKDALAEALGLTSRDSVLVIFRKRSGC